MRKSVVNSYCFLSLKYAKRQQFTPGISHLLKFVACPLAAFVLGMMLLELVRLQSGNLFSKCRIQTMNPLTKIIAAALRISLNVCKGAGSNLSCKFWTFGYKDIYPEVLIKSKTCWMTGSQTEFSLLPVPRRWCLTNPLCVCWCLAYSWAATVCRWQCVLIL